MKGKKRKKVIEEVFAYLFDHYWDSLEDARHMLELHLKACKSQLEKVGKEGQTDG